MTTIAIMNAKGGVGKSTITLAIAECLAAYHGKRVLLVDADGQMSLSLMTMPVGTLQTLGAREQTLGGWLMGLLPGAKAKQWQECVTGPVCDVDDSQDVYLMAGDMDLTLVERELVATKSIDTLRRSVRSFLSEAAQLVDYVLIDCAPGISIGTEVFLREAQWHLVPVRPDILAVSGMQYLKRFRQRDPRLGFARHLGVVINMMRAQSETDMMIGDILNGDADLQCFPASIPQIGHIQKAAIYQKEKRSFLNKYPGEAGTAIRTITQEIMWRTSLDH